MHVRPLPSGPLAFIGDVHGELEALTALHERLDDRHRVYVGDLIDRGPDSPGVVALVQQEHEADKASVVLGNHELNLIRGLEKPDNRWFRGEVQLFDGQVMPQAFASERDQRRILDFLLGLPLALERPDVRVVHASWGPIEEIRGRRESVPALFRSYEHRIMEDIRRRGQDQPGWRARWRALHERSVQPPLDREMQDQEYRIQNGNPVKWLTSGPEDRREELVWLSGRWRQLERLAWWRGYHDDVAVVIGHYWRTLAPHRPSLPVATGMFAGGPPHQGLGPRRNVFCIDYSVGKRFLDRMRDRPFTGRLAALLWPEQRLVFDNGEEFDARYLPPLPG